LKHLLARFGCLSNCKREGGGKAVPTEIERRERKLKLKGSSYLDGDRRQYLICLSTLPKVAEEVESCV
jgi:hypothetical protein